MPSYALRMASCATAWACASRVAAPASMFATAVASKLPCTTFWMVGTSCVCVIAARHAGLSEFQFLTMEALAFQLNQTGLDSPTTFAFIWMDVSALPYHGGIQAAMR